MSYITICSDASISVRNKRSGFAYYIRDDYGTTALAWAVDKTMNTFEAELTAALAALRVVSERKYEGETTLIYYCDNMHVVQCINRNFAREKSYAKYAEPIEIIEGLVEKIDTVVAMYVESHTDYKDKTLGKRHHMNRWCDHNSRSMQQMNEYHHIYKRNSEWLTGKEQHETK